MEYSKFTFNTALQLAAPQTWSASVIPVLLAASCAAANRFVLDPPLLFVLLLASVLMQSAVNAMNDYYDFVKGTDTLEDNLEVEDAALLHSNVKPKSALHFAVSLVAAAFVAGIYVMLVAGWPPLAIALVGAACVFLYSGGKTPISYLPMGELVSGVVMGGLITLACYYSISLGFDWAALAWAAPVMLQIALVMLSNNTCDIEKDEAAGRRTLPVILGRRRAVGLYRCAAVADYLIIAAMVALWFPSGAVALPFLVLLSLPVAMGLWKCPFDQPSRVRAMSLASNFNACMGAMYCVCILMHGTMG